jgi:TonB family protein
VHGLLCAPGSDSETRGPPLRTSLAVLLLTIPGAFVVAGGATTIANPVQLHAVRALQQDSLSTPQFLRDSKFSAIAHTSLQNICSSSQPPEALATPEPLLESPDSQLKVTVSFIVGTDGRVHSPLILESSGARDDSRVLNAVQRWRYRPATCNGVPTEAEANIEFSSH